MEIKELKEKINFTSIINLLKEEWPKEWETLSDEKMVDFFEKSCDYKYDINKFLYDNNEVIGWYRYSAWPREKKNKENAHILDIVIDSEYQGKGLGKMMMENLILDCKKRRFKKIMSRTIEGNIQSYKLHETNGFKILFRKDIDIVWEIKLESEIK